MTSANVTHYELRDQNMSLVAAASQHCMCVDRIGKVLEKWEKKWPEALLCLRWPDEHEVDQYLTFEEVDGYDDMGFDSDIFMCEERDTITLRAFMRRRRLKEIASNESMLKYLRDKLKEHTGNQHCKDHKMRKAYHEFRKEAEASAALMGPSVIAHCYIGDDGEFVKEFMIVGLSELSVKKLSEGV